MSRVEQFTPEQLRQMADDIESQNRRECTGLAASWCPIHGDCACPERENALDDWNCPLHSPVSAHAPEATTPPSTPADTQPSNESEE